MRRVRIQNTHQKPYVYVGALTTEHMLFNKNTVALLQE
jgi:hypothetical protein